MTDRIAGRELEGVLTAMVRRNTIVKIVLVMAALAGLGVLFVRSVRNTRSAPYAVDQEHLHNWTVALEQPSTASDPLLLLRPRPELSADLFRQVFTRTMESMSAPHPPGIPLVLQGELNHGSAGRITPDALVAAARTAGLEQATFAPRCLAYRRVSEPGVTRQLYFVLFETPEFTRFRAQIGDMLDHEAGGRAGFDPAALSPVLFVAASPAAFSSWLPLRADPETDCVAPIAIS